MAIAFDAASGNFVNPATSLTVSHTCTGSDRALCVTTVGDTSDTHTGVTYAGVSMTLVTKVHAGGGRWLYSWYLNAPATGTNDIICSASGSSYIEINAASYTGVSQTGQPEANGTAANAASAGPLSVSVTTTTDLAWTVLHGLGSAGTIVASSGCTRRNTALIGAIFDSAADQTPAGSKSMSFSQASANTIEGIAISLAPSAGGGGGGSNIAAISNYYRMMRSA